jgi:hypothetical protein
MANYKFNIYNDSIILVKTSSGSPVTCSGGLEVRLQYYAIPDLITGSNSASENADAGTITIGTNERYHIALVNHVLFNLTNKQIYYDLYNDEVRKCRRDKNRSQIGALKHTPY